MIRSIFRSRDGKIIRDLSPEQVRDALDDKAGVLWLDVDPSEDRIQIESLFRDLFGFHPLALEDALEGSHVPRVDDWQSHLFIVLLAVRLKDDHSLETPELDLFLGPNYLVSVHRGALAPLDHLWGQSLQTPDRRLTSSWRLLHALADAVADGYLPVVDELDEEIDRSNRPSSGGLGRNWFGGSSPCDARCCNFGEPWARCERC